MSTPTWSTIFQISRVLVCLLGLGLVLTGCIPRGSSTSGSAGSRCSNDTQCSFGLTCLTPSDGFPGGYCSTTDCEQTGCPSSAFASAACAHIDEERTTTACVQQCSADADCRQTEGYVCSDLEGISGCMPTEIAAAAAGQIGSSCLADTDCNGELTCLTNFLSGYCSQTCETGGDCGDDAACIDLGGGSLRCLDRCDADSQCRFGYKCEALDDSTSVCTPDSSMNNPVRNPGGAPDGQPCTEDNDCMGGTCITGTDFPGGYCSTRSCDLVGCSTSDATCVNLPSEPLCFANCASSDDCREGYRCTALQSGSGVCYAESPGTTPMIDTGGPIEINCDPQSTGSNRWSFSFELDAGDVGFSAVPFSQSGAEIIPLRLTTPSGDVLDFESEYGFQTINSLLLGTIVPMSFPGAPQFDYLIEPGTYTFEYETGDNNTCYFVVEQPALGNSIDVNFYLVGVDGVTVDNAASEPNMVALVDEFRSIYQGAGISLGTVRYLALDPSEEERYRIIRDFDEVYDLLALTESPGETRDDALSINVFLIEDFNIDGLPGLLGLSPGIPGAPGVHGNSAAGLVFSSANLNQAPDALAQTMAHEIGHFLGLRHTTERGASEVDPLNDTPSCSDPNEQFACPDVNNLMFPFRVDVVQHTVTNDQRFVLQRHPLVK